MRQCENDWISTYLDYTETASPPEIYHKWVAVSVIAGALQKRVALDGGWFTIFPNHYIALIGPPGTGKTTACRIGMDLLKELDGIHFSSQSGSREALINTLLESVSVFSDPAKEIQEGQDYVKGYTQSAVMAYCNELSSLLANDQVNMLEFLTDIFDQTGATWTHNTISRDKQIVREPCLNLLTTATTRRLIELIPVSAIEGGFASRTIFAYGEESRDVPVFQEKLVNEEHKEALITDLKEIGTIVGNFGLTDSAREFYEDWNKTFKKELKSDYLEGFIERKRSHILRLGIIFSASESSNRIVEKHHLKKALDWINAIEPSIKKIFVGSGRNRGAVDMARMLDQIISYGSISYGALLEANSHNVTLSEFDEILKTLEATGAIDIISTPGGDKIIRAKDN